MKKLTFLLLIISNFQLFAQENVGKHTISFETGIYHRGLAGIGYNYNLLIDSGPNFFSFHGSAGLGPGFDGDPNYYFTLAPSANLGSGPLYFNIGIETKYMRQTYLSAETLFDEVGVFKGFAMGPFMGINIFGGSGFNFRAKFGFVYQPSAVDKLPVLPGVGLAFGYSFGS